MRLRHPILLIPALATLWAADPAAERLKRFNDAKFGMFIHWGPHSLASVEASWPIMVPGKWGISEADYRALPQRFNPVRYDPQAWVRLAREAGQRYMVFTSKHHDGFAMFDSAYTDYKITKTPYGKDIAKMLADAARAEGMPLGFYYSPPDMNHPGFRDTSKLSATNFRGEPQRPEWPLYLDYMELQLTELLTRYGDLFVVWFDGLSNQQVYDGRRFHKLIREMQPAALINNRIGLTGDYVTPEQRLPKGIPTRAAKVGNTDPNDKGLASAAPRPEEFQPWETCMTINGTWAYNRNDSRYKSTTELVRALIEAASKGGNFLLNVGPAPDGTIQPEFESRLRGIGAWLKVYGESIYGSTYGPVQDLAWGRTTAKGGTVFVHIFDRQAGALELPGWQGKVTRVRALKGGTSLKFTQTGKALTIQASAIPEDEHAAVIAIESSPASTPSMPRK